MADSSNSDFIQKEETNSDETRNRGLKTTNVESTRNQNLEEIFEAEYMTKITWILLPDGTPVKPKRLKDYTISQATSLLRKIRLQNPLGNSGSSKEVEPPIYPREIIRKAERILHRLPDLLKIYQETQRKYSSVPDIEDKSLAAIFSLIDGWIYDSPIGPYDVMVEMYEEFEGVLDLADAIDDYREKIFSKGAWYENPLSGSLTIDQDLKITNPEGVRNQYLKLGFAVEKFLGLEMCSKTSLDELIDRIIFHPLSKEIEKRLSEFPSRDPTSS